MNEETINYISLKEENKEMFFKNSLDSKKVTKTINITNDPILLENKPVMIDTVYLGLNSNVYISSSVSFGLVITQKLNGDSTVYTFRNFKFKENKVNSSGSLIISTSCIAILESCFYTLLSDACNRNFIKLNGGILIVKGGNIEQSEHYNNNSFSTFDITNRYRYF